MNALFPSISRFVLSVVLLVLAGSGTAFAMPAFVNELTQLCIKAARPAPVLNAETCTSCHSDTPGGTSTLLAVGQVFQRYWGQPDQASLNTVLDTFCKGAYFNVQYNQNDRLNNGALPPLWNRPPASLSYKGALPVHWLAELGGDNQNLVLSRAEAELKTSRLPDTFNLLAMPENCWGEKMNFGLVRLTRKANLNIRIESDASQNSDLIPGFAFYRGWDQGQTAQNHDVIVFGDNNPLSTTGLTFLGQALASTRGAVAEQSFTGLEPGNYELFVTVGTNRSALGEYVLTLSTSPPGSGLNVVKNGNGRVISQPAGIDCGSTCNSAFAVGAQVNLTAQPEPGYRFSQWDGCPVQTGDICTVRLDYSRTLTARFEPITHRLTVKPSASSTVYSLDSKISCGLNSLGLCQADYPEGIRVTLFQKGKGSWSGSCAGLANRCELSLAADACVATQVAGDVPVSCDPVASVPGANTAEPVAGVCGTARDSLVSSQPKTAEALCQTGKPTQPTRLKDGRYSWLCAAIGPAATARCYTLGSSGKRNQSSLIFKPDASTDVAAGGQLGFTLEGGSGSGALSITQSHQVGVVCTVTRTGQRVRVVAGRTPGTCTLIATKAGNRSYNAVQSAPVTVTIKP